MTRFGLPRHFPPTDTCASARVDGGAKSSGSPTAGDFNSVPTMRFRAFPQRGARKRCTPDGAIATTALGPLGRRHSTPCGNFIRRLAALICFIAQSIAAAAGNTDVIKSNLTDSEPMLANWSMGIYAVEVVSLLKPGTNDNPPLLRLRLNSTLRPCAEGMRLSATEIDAVWEPERVYAEMYPDAIQQPAQNLGISPNWAARPVHTPGSGAQLIVFARELRPYRTEDGKRIRADAPVLHVAAEAVYLDSEAGRQLVQSSAKRRPLGQSLREAWLITILGLSGVALGATIFSNRSAMVLAGLAIVLYATYEPIMANRLNAGLAAFYVYPALVVDLLILLVGVVRIIGLPGLPGRWHRSK